MEDPGRSEAAMHITDNPDRRRWEVTEDEAVVAYAEYRMEPGRVTFTHTVVQPDHEGRGIATLLARFVLDDAIARGLRITPRCPFIRAFIQRHPEYAPYADMPEPR